MVAKKGKGKPRWTLTETILTKKRNQKLQSRKIILFVSLRPIPQSDQSNRVHFNSVEVVAST